MLREGVVKLEPRRIGLALRRGVANPELSVPGDGAGAARRHSQSEARSLELGGR